LAEFILLQFQFSCFPEFLGVDLPTMQGLWRNLVDLSKYE
jgi:hypothetical protein